MTHKKNQRSINSQNTVSPSAITRVGRMMLGLTAFVLLSLAAEAAVPTCYNIGSLGAAGDGTHIDSVAVYQPGAVGIGPDHSTRYSGGARTTIPFTAALNPASGSPFTIEFWAKPQASDNDDCPVF